MYSAVPQDRVAYFVWRAADKLERNTKGSGAARFAGVGPQELPTILISQQERKRTGYYQNIFCQYSVHVMKVYSLSLDRSCERDAFGKKRLSCSALP
jgi:hypothetical protein